MRKILLSIKPEYVEQILAGTKLVEYRKRIPKDAVGMKVLIYCSSPIKRVVAEFTIGNFLLGSPGELWLKTSTVGGVSQKTYEDYFENKTRAFAYQITDLRIFEQPKSLSDYGVVTAPQDYCYIEA